MPPAIRQHGGQKHQAEEGLDPELADPELQQSGRDDIGKGGAEQRADDGDPPAREQGAAEHRREEGRSSQS